jgi:hypothetical protein
MTSAPAPDTEFLKLDVISRIQQIGEKLLEKDPLLPTHLGAIHSTLIQYEELVHLLSDEQIKTLIAGQKKHTGNMVVAEITKTSKATVGKRIPKTTVDDL